MKQTRSFVRHKVFGTLFAVAIDEGGTVLAAVLVAEAVACRHRLAAYDFSLDLAPDIMSNLADYEPYEPPCTDATHLLADIGEASRKVEAAQASFDVAHQHAKSLKEL